MTEDWDVKIKTGYDQIWIEFRVANQYFQIGDKYRTSDIDAGDMQFFVAMFQSALGELGVKKAKEFADTWRAQKRNVMDKKKLDIKFTEQARADVDRIMDEHGKDGFMAVSKMVNQIAENPELGQRVFESMCPELEALVKQITGRKLTNFFSWTFSDGEKSSFTGKGKDVEIELGDMMMGCMGYEKADDYAVSQDEELTFETLTHDGTSFFATFSSNTGVTINRKCVMVSIFPKSAIQNYDEEGEEETELHPG